MKNPTSNKKKNWFIFFNIKKGEEGLTMGQIVTWLVLIAGFIVVLLFLLFIDLPGQSDEQICHASIIGRAYSPLEGDSLPIKCKTDYICLSKDNKCDKMTNPEIQKVKTKENVYKFLGEKMVDCWWMFGEGKYDYVGKETSQNNYCSICYQIAFDESVEEIFHSGELDKDEFYEYLSENKVSGKDVTYSQYLFGAKNLDTVKNLASQKYAFKATFGSLDLSKSHYIMMGITSEVSMAEWVSIGAIGGGAASAVGGFIIGFLGLSTPIGWVVGAAIIGGGAIIGAGEYYLSDSIDPEVSSIMVEGRGVENNFMAPTIIEADAERYKALNCADLQTLS